MRLLKSLGDWRSFLDLASLLLLVLELEALKTAERLYFSSI